MIDSLYHWVKALHIISVVAWMCGMLYLPRLFVYHSQVAPGSEASELFKVMEKKLMRIIINPAMIATWLFGLWLANYIHAFDPVNGYWMHYKLVLVLLMQVVHAMMSRWRKAFERDERPKSEKFFRIFNEIPTIFMIVIIFLVVVRPV